MTAEASLSWARYSWRTELSPPVPSTANEGPLGMLTEHFRQSISRRDGMIFREFRVRLGLGITEVAGGWRIDKAEVGELERGVRRFPTTDDLMAALNQLWVWHFEARREGRATADHPKYAPSEEHDVQP